MRRTIMSHAQPHTVHHTHAPRAHRDAVPMHMPRHTGRGPWHARTTEPDTSDFDFASAQTVFYVARGVAVLLAAIAVSLSAAPDETKQPPTGSPTASHAITR